MINVQLGSKQEEKPPVKSFPKLMKGLRSGAIYFMTGEKKGVRIYSPDGYHQEYSTFLEMTALTDYNEPVTLQNA